MEEIVTCPKCLGMQELFSFANDTIEKCNFCLGEGGVAASKADAYDPIDTEDFMYKEDE